MHSFTPSLCGAGGVLYINQSEEGEIEMKNIFGCVAVIALFAFGCASNQPVECVDGNCNDGKGKMQLKSGSTYQGEFKDGTRAGAGVFVWSSKDKYDGEWQAGKRMGKGVYTYPDGSVYNGEFKDDMRNGMGTYTWSNGEKYVGEWKNGKMDGQGTYTYPDGRELKGLFRENSYVHTVK